MGDEGERAEPVAGPDHDYTAFQKWQYQSVILPTEHEQFWRDMADSYFNACRPLIAALAAGHLNEDVEGTAAIFLFRHYLELMLKRIIWAGRQLISENEVATRDVPNVANIHDLAKLWEWVIADAKPKLNEWQNYDTVSLAKCLMEFDQADKKGFAFRYDGCGGKRFRFNFEALARQMDHLRQVLEGLCVTLDTMRDQIREYDAYLESEFGSDLYW
jgi:hypothetical protein